MINCYETKLKNYARSVLRAIIEGDDGYTDDDLRECLRVLGDL